MTRPQADRYTNQQLRDKMLFNDEMISSDENQKRATRLRNENDMIMSVLVQRGAFFGTERGY